MRNRITVFIVVSIFALIMLSACSAVNDISTVNAGGNAFMTALRDGDNAASWIMLVPSVQTEIGGESAWATFTASRKFSVWKFTNTNVNNNDAQLDGEATLGAETYIVQLVYAKTNDAWKISGINFKLKSN